MVAPCPAWQEKYTKAMQHAAEIKVRAEHFETAIDADQTLPRP